jgi:hypothetical protein
MMKKHWLEKNEIIADILIHHDGYHFIYLLSEHLFIICV